MFLDKEEKRLTERQERGKPPEQKKLTIKGEMLFI